MIDVALPKNEEVELVFGLAGPVGTDFKVVSDALRDALNDVQYTSNVVRLSAFLPEYNLRNGLLPIDLTSKYEDERIRAYQDAGNALREALDENAALAIRAIRHISESRLKTAGADATPATVKPRRHAYILHSLKRPEEVDQLRAVYNGGFFLIAVVAPKSLRISSLAERIAGSRDTTDVERYRSAARQLVNRDEEEDSTYGQLLSETFPTADLFVSFGNGSAAAKKDLINEIRRFVRLIMGANDVTPSADEVAMSHAFTAAMRSGSLARQVGAALTTAGKDVVTTGCNDVPAAGGGIYWANDHYDHRDIKHQRDSADAHEEEMVTELIKELHGAGWCPEPPPVPAAMKRLSKTRVMNLLEFSRSLHAEMEALLSAGRHGHSTMGALIFSTTFPCHECAKLILGAGISEVIYIEPYPKSRVAQMFAREIATEPFRSICRACGTPSTDEKRCPECDGTSLLLFDEAGRCSECGKQHLLPFRPFVGVGPRRFVELFAMVTMQGTKFKRKDKLGNRLPWTPAQRRPMFPLSYIEKESFLVTGYEAAFARLARKGI